MGDTGRGCGRYVGPPVSDLPAAEWQIGNWGPRSAAQNGHHPLGRKKYAAAALPAVTSSRNSQLRADVRPDDPPSTSMAMCGASTAGAVADEPSVASLRAGEG